MKNYKEITSRIKELAQDPSALQAHVSNNIGGISNDLPNISQGISNHMGRAVSYLNSKIPGPVTVLPLTKKFDPSEPQKAKFARHYEAVDNPLSLLHHISEGTLSQDHVEAASAVHPELYKEMQQKIKQEISPEKAAALPNHVRRGLSMFLQTPLEQSDMQIVKMANQATFAAGPKPSQAGMQGKSTEGGMSKLKIGSRAETETGRDEGEK